eukprot:1148208-Pelagomonas_calceolata.AAC.19
MLPLCRLQLLPEPCVLTGLGFSPVSHLTINCLNLRVFLAGLLGSTKLHSSREAIFLELPRPRVRMWFGKAHGKKRKEDYASQRPRALRKGLLNSKLERVSPKGPQT